MVSARIAKAPPLLRPRDTRENADNIRRLGKISEKALARFVAKARAFYHRHAQVLIILWSPGFAHKRGDAIPRDPVRFFS